MWRSLAVAAVCVAAVVAWWSPAWTHLHSMGWDGPNVILVPAGDDHGGGH